MKPLGHTMAIERLLTGSIREHVSEFIQTEDLVLDSFKDLVKDELKTYIRTKIDEDEELKAEIKEAVKYYFNAKARSLYAEFKEWLGDHENNKIADPVIFCNYLGDSTH